MKILISALISLFPLAILLFTDVFKATTGIIILTAIAAVANFFALQLVKLEGNQTIIAYVGYLVVTLGALSLF
jgi:hypothetical protein